MSISIDPIFLTTTKIVRVSGAREIGSATGFFYTKNNEIFLITNKHVIYGDKFAETDAKPEIDKVKIILHTNVADLTQNDTETINLFDGTKILWKEHKQKNIDVICIPINLDRAKYHFLTVSDDVLDTAGLKLHFEKLFIMGYPLGWSDTTHNLPITRIGHLSSPFGVPFDGKPYMLGDVETHPGMSGSPVFMYLKDYISETPDGGLVTNIGATKNVLIGVFSGAPIWSVTDTVTNSPKNIPHSLSVIWFGLLIREIV